MVFETEVMALITGNAVGVLFGLLMYRMATGAIKENTAMLHKLSEVIGRMR
jgi:hypothetical protein